MLFSDADKQRIEAAVRAAELQSTGEIVVAHVRQSARYGSERLALAFVIAMLTSLLIAVFYPAVVSLYVLAAQLVSFGLTWALLGVPVFGRMLLRPTQFDDAVRARAAQFFSEHGVHATRDRTGVLILLSELEHRVVILGDSGINAKLGVNAWGDYVRVMTEAVRKGEAGQGVVTVIAALSETLARHFPRRADDVNELPDAVVNDP
ncbi:MAG: TPM domain-containing protein [Clostridia bacterium]|nr:TPM domain-containing protein [Deltaproteobacteria bacterium]